MKTTGLIRKRKNEAIQRIVADYLEVYGPYPCEIKMDNGAGPTKPAVTIIFKCPADGIDLGLEIYLQLQAAPAYPRPFTIQMKVYELEVADTLIWESFVDQACFRDDLQTRFLQGWD